jgi:membrane associated rhomboid family serine protease
MEKERYVLTAKEDKNKILYSLIVSSVFIIILWIIKLSEGILGISFSEYGVYPRSPEGLKGVIFSPLIHSDFSHLISNSTTLFVSMFVLLYFYRDSAYKVLLIVWVVTGLSVWWIGRESFHIGASGVIYGLISFLFFSGILRKDKRAVALSLLMVFLYGGLVWGVLPIKEDVSFESHLMGALAGLVCALIFRKSDPPMKYEWEKDEEEEEEDLLNDDTDDVDPDEVEIDENAEPKIF